VGSLSYSSHFQQVTRESDLGLDSSCMSSFLSLSVFIIIIFFKKILFLIDFNNKVVYSRVGS